ncbi:hypothetical protein LENED_010439 [Lentinula edodes]|uniref:Uncharacterized protein n=1 Tax=Lentinula edodes TaxID=5353 RepID=A0A1Q3EMG6_LENED|nr:hypothetical protein LENED_010439 [Lentinula edodes]
MAFHPSLPLSTPARIHDFTLWFTYYPPLHPAPLSLLHTHLKSSPQTSLPFYTTLSLLLARKGYISFSNTHLLPSISRFSSSPSFLEFYHTYESSIHSYFSTLKSPTGLRKTLSITRSIAIRFLAEAGHLSLATSLLSPRRRRRGGWSGIYGRSRNAITLLHTHTLRLSPIPLRAISHLLFAHMVLLFRLGTRSPSPSIPSLGPRALRALLDLFLKHFHIHGVSVPTMLQYTSTTEDSSDSSDSDSSSSFYLSTLSSSTPPPHTPSSQNSSPPGCTSLSSGNPSPTSRPLTTRSSSSTTSSSTTRVPNPKSIPKSSPNKSPPPISKHPNHGPAAVIVSPLPLPPTHLSNGIPTLTPHP